MLESRGRLCPQLRTRPARWILFGALGLGLGWVPSLEGGDRGEGTTLTWGAPEAEAKPPKRRRRSKARRKKSRRSRKSRRAAPAPAAVAPPAAAPAPASLPTRGPTRVDFDDRLVQGQTNQSGAVVLFARKASGLRSMVDRRKSFRERTIRTVFDRGVGK